MADRKRDGRSRKGGVPRDALASFLPSVARWFEKTFAAPSPAQALAWPAIRRGENVLLLAPTGSGKTLAAFLCAIDDLLRRGLAGDSLPGVSVLYITPLKALGNDIHRNLLEPLASIRGGSEEDLPELRVAVRTGDTPAAERAKMGRQPPHLLITTPESLYLLLGSSRMAAALRSVRTVIIDEVHALCGNKRGVHLAVSLERLQAIAEGPLQRVGCSATLSPLEKIAAFLVGCDDQGTVRPCTILDAGMRKELDVRAVAPLPDFLEASNTALWSSAYALLLDEVARHRTTLIFCNSRYKAERTVLRLRELAEDGARIGVHHGSMSRETRLEAEDELKSGRLSALVATASLELGIDIGAIDLVYQLESPKSVAIGLQRVGRAGHLLDATSKGRMLLFERDELVEAAAISKAMLAGEVDAIAIPSGCLDVLAQQIAGAVAADDWQADELLALLRRSYPYRDLTEEHFERVLAMLAGEHPFRMARPPLPLLLWDRAAGRLSTTRGAAHVAAMCVGTIPETSEYDVVIAESGKRVGSVQSEFVDDSLRTGDVFVLGSSSWRVAGVQRNRLLVEQAPGATPTVPWWHGPVVDRTPEVGQRVGALRRAVAARLRDPGAEAWVQQEYHLCPHGAEALVEYLREQQAAAGLVPDHESLLVETWRDELGRNNVTIHCPLGQRINRTWGEALAAAAKQRLRQDWSVTATNDLVLLAQSNAEAPPPDAAALLSTLTPDEVPELLAARARRAASLSGPFRDAAVCSFQILRAWQGRRVPLWLQTLRAQELHDAARQHPDYVVNAEVLREYLEQTLDMAGLQRLLGWIAAGEVSLTFQEVESPSPFAHSALIQDQYRSDHQMGRERRAHLLRLHRQVLQEVLTAEQMAELLDPRAIETLERRRLHRSEVSRAETSDELAQVIHDLGDLPATMEAAQQVCAADAATLLAPLLEGRRVLAIRIPECEQDPERLVAADLWRQYHDAFALGHDRVPPLIPQLEDDAITGFEEGAATKLIPARWRRPQPAAEARKEIVARYLRCRGPITLYELANHTGWPAPTIEAILDGLVAEGAAARGIYTSAKPRPQWVDKANLEEIHRLTLGHLRRELSACAPREVVDFMVRWQHLHPETRLHGLDGLRQVIRQLQGVEVMQGALESEVLPGRVADYRPEMLDALIARGEVCWRQLNPRRLRRGPISLCLRQDGEWLARGGPVEVDAEQEADVDIPEVIAAVRGYFREHGTAFFDELLAATGCDEGAVTRAVWHLAWCGEVTCDTYECVRYADFQVMLSACYDLDSTPRKLVSGRVSQDRVLKQMRKRRLDPRLGRWWATERLIPLAKPMPEREVAARWAGQLLRRWGIVTRDLVASEAAAPPWSELLRELKRLELLGRVSRGYFIESHHGEQYGLPEAIELLRDCRARRAEDETGYLPDEPLLTMTNRDPANLYATSLEIADERGRAFRRGMKSGNVVRRMVVQAGQVLVYGSHQLVALTRPQLGRCLETLQRDPSGQEAALSFGDWNGHPIDVSPVAAVMHRLGFRNENGRMCWPSSRNSRAPADSGQETFLPYFAEPDPVEYGPKWLITRAQEPLRPALERLLEIVIPYLEEHGWTIEWGAPNTWARYRDDKARVWIRLARSFIEVHPWAVAVQVKGESRRRRFWRNLRVVSLDDLTPEKAEAMLDVLRAAQAQADLYLAKRR
jgi:ATP-dependent Lhr-like helicase